MAFVLVVTASALLLVWWPWCLAAPAGRLLGWFAGSILRVRRAEVEERLARAGIAAPSLVATQMYTSLGAALYELLWTAAPGPRPLDRKVLLSLRAAQALEVVRGRGAVVAATHTGNWDLAACAVAARAPLWVVSKRLRVRWLDQGWQRLRVARGVRIVEPSGAIVSARRAIASGGLVAMLLDQRPERKTGVLAAPFLGLPALHDLAPALLAARLRVPLALALSRRLPDGTHEIDVPLLLEPPPRAGRLWAEEATRRLIEALEAFVRAHPDQWLWLHRRWQGSRTKLPLAHRGESSSSAITIP
ncbi:MAG: lysophospholipid acyltransferase family protein [Myxococcales bacterium]|nr:lysophospholipid acyltransferase family protein [Polyangiaceae bacterium]MDW8250232.1 lysophospholipid acyltransferase family protein [Myxococcales bacterium]